MSGTQHSQQAAGSGGDFAEAPGGTTAAGMCDAATTWLPQFMTRHCCLHWPPCSHCTQQLASPGAGAHLAAPPWCRLRCCTGTPGCATPGAGGPRGWTAAAAWPPRRPCRPWSQQQQPGPAAAPALHLCPPHQSAEISDTDEGSECSKGVLARVVAELVGLLLEEELACSSGAGCMRVPDGGRSCRISHHLLHLLQQTRCCRCCWRLHVFC
jgi:hypothetical protein